MKEINYKFVDGTNKTIKVDEKFYKNYEEIETQTKKIERKETRRQISLSSFIEKGIEFEDKDSYIEENFIKQETKEEIINAIRQLNKKQQDLVYQVFYLNKSLSEVAREKNISKSTITQQMQHIYKKMKDFLKKF
ncbi:MAG: sigma-70 family RNA polymerase sigma factor [Clostridia bacterium]|nr:sigma-70 family RNA polymerase sigma factor [Clostridia bacterium]